MNQTTQAKTRSNRTATPPCPPHVKRAFEAIPASQRKVLMKLRKLILQTHRQTAGAGDLVEDLRWSQPSYLTEKPVTGTMIRLGLTQDKRPALFFHCQTNLIGQFRRRYQGLFDYDGNRALLPGDDIDQVRSQLAECIAAALMYKRN